MTARSKQPDFDVYVYCMVNVRERLNFILTHAASKAITPNAAWDVEILFFQFRRILEFLAFSSLAANFEAYTAAQKKFRSHYNADKMLRYVEAVNPGFYPKPITITKTGPMKASVTLVEGGFLTKQDFVKLYNVSSDVIHTPNPWREGNPQITFHYTVEQWAQRIRRLLELHTVLMVGEKERWIVTVPETGMPQVGIAARVN